MSEKEAEGAVNKKAYHRKRSIVYTITQIICLQVVRFAFEVTFFASVTFILSYIL